MNTALSFCNGNQEQQKGCHALNGVYCMQSAQCGKTPNREPEEIGKIRISGLEFEEGCPEGCRGHNERMYQGSLCTRCPIFNCRKTEDGWSLLEPEEYNPEWAKQFWEYIYNNGIRPVLHFEVSL